jgi:single-stranded-DNA-specific exonuclease
MAAGLHVKRRKVDEFRRRINGIATDVLPENPVPYMIYDSKLKLRNINMKLVGELEKLEPFGMGNPVPNFVIEDVRCARDRITTDGQHMQLSVSQKGSLLSAIGFWLAGHKEIIKDPAQKFDLLCMLERGKDDTEKMIVRDIKEVGVNW